MENAFYFTLKAFLFSSYFNSLKLCDFLVIWKVGLIRKIILVLNLWRHNLGENNYNTYIAQYLKKAIGQWDLVSQSVVSMGEKLGSCVLKIFGHKHWRELKNIHTYEWIVMSDAIPIRKGDSFFYPSLSVFYEVLNKDCSMTKIVSNFVNVVLKKLVVNI